MGQQIRIDGSVEEHEEDKRIGQLKREARFPDGDIVVYDVGDGMTPVSDRDTVGDIPEDAAVASQPEKGRIFG